MQEELQSKLVEILTSIQAATGKAADFAMDQLPDIAQSYVVYGRVSSTFAVFGSAAVIAALLYFSKAYEKESEGVSWIGGGFTAIFPAMAFCFSIGDFFLVWFAPKVWLLKEFAQLVK